VTNPILHGRQNPLQEITEAVVFNVKHVGVRVELQKGARCGF
jgi:hypothetical protein